MAMSYIHVLSSTAATQEKRFHLFSCYLLFFSFCG